MATAAPALNDRAHPSYFWVGSAAVTAGVALHLPMFIEASAMNYHLAGMPMDWGMLVGMAFIGIGVVTAWYGLLPGPRRSEPPPYPKDEPATPAAVADRKLNGAHWQLMLVLALSLVIDAMKPASLGFTIPGMSQEYGLSREVVALFPLLALSGLTIGSYVWGVIGDQVGRRAAILLSGIMFVGTAICGAMPGFVSNLIMCFFMGWAAGGMLPITYALLAECVPARQRGWAMVLLGGLGLVGGFFAASGCAALLEPEYGWRIMWFMNAPTGLLLIVGNRLIPESPRFLLLRGRVDEARAMAARFGVSVGAEHWHGASSRSRVDTTGALLRAPFWSTTATLNLVAIAWGLINFGLLLWLPAELRARGYGVAGSDVLLLQSTLVALPTMFVVASLYGRWSTKWTLFILTLLTALGLLGLALMEGGISMSRNHLMAVISVLMVGVNGIIALLLPYSAESYPILVRGRATGLVAGASKFGGLAAQVVTMASLVPGLGTAAIALAVPITVSAVLVARYGKETRHRILEDFD